MYRHGQVNRVYGLFEGNDRIDQVRGFDLSNISFIEGGTGWIVFDPLIAIETAGSALVSFDENAARRPVVAAPVRRVAMQRVECSSEK